jgi:hypothetical protein
MSKPRKLKTPHSLKIKNLVFAILLFAGAAVGINYVIQANNQTSEYLVASRDLPAGSTFSLDDSVPAAFNLGLSADQYLKEGDLPQGGYLLGPVRAGQLIPRSQVASAVIDERVPVVINSAMGLPVGLVPGASVDVWVSPLDENNVFQEPFVLVIGAEVSQLIESKEMFADQNPEVELWVPVEAVGPVLSSVTSGASISLILKPTLADG